MVKAMNNINNKGGFTMTTQDFIKKLTPDNNALTNKMEAAKTSEDAYGIAKAEGVTDSFDTFVSEMKKLNEAVKDLSDDDLANVAGGSDATDIVTAVTATITAATGAATAAAV
jgi:pyruvate dehydrogenase complex dehydrogenase (E1) component